MRSPTGQASAEYVAVVALVAVVIAAAASLVAAPDLAGSVVHSLRLGLCIVGGDVCRSSDAAARGLEPCVQSDERRDKEDGLAFVVRSYDGGSLVVRRLSDGTWTLEVARGNGVGVGKVLDVHLGPVQISAEAGGRTIWRAGAQWRMTEAQVRDVLARMKDPSSLADPRVAELADLPPADVRFTEGGASAELAASAALGAEQGRIALDLASAKGELLLGRRRGGGPDVWYFRSSAGLETAIDGLGLPATGVVGEYHEGSPPALVLRSTRAAGAGTEVEQVVTWPLRSAPDRAAAIRLLSGARSSPAPAAADARRLLDGIAADGTRERRTYETTTEDGGFAVEAFGFGLDHSTSTTRRRLVGADVMTGGRTVRRIDCLGLERS